MRRDLITRTISGTKVTAKVIEATTDAIELKEFTLNKVMADTKKIAKEITKKFEGTNYVLVSIENVEKIDKLYGITVDDFMSHAIELDPATREAINQ